MVIEFDFSETIKVTSAWKHFSVTPEGKINVFFQDNQHVQLDRDELGATGEAALVNLVGIVAKQGAEKRSAGASAGIDETSIREEFNAAHDALKEAENPVKEK